MIHVISSFFAMQEIKRSIQFDYVVYDIKNKDIVQFSKDCSDKYYLETFCDVDVSVTLGSNLDMHKHCDRDVKDDTLAEVIEKLKEKLDLTNCMIIAFHDDDMRKDVEGIGGPVPIERKYVSRYLKQLTSRFAPRPQIVSEKEYTYGKVTVLYAEVIC